MANILVRDLPEGVHAALQAKAKKRHQSLQQYLSEELRNLAGRRDVNEILDEIDSRTGGEVGLSQAVQDLRSERERQ